MNSRKEALSTKSQLVNSYIKLLLSVPFEKITIKMITDDAGVIRPTFYNYFQDKYEVMEYIFQENIVNKVAMVLDHHMETEAVRLLFHCLYKDRDLYKKAYTIDGPNSFDHMMFTFINNTFYQLIKHHPLKPDKSNGMLTTEMIAKYYTFGLADAIKSWLTTDNKFSAEDACDAYDYLLHHSFAELVKR